MRDTDDADDDLEEATGVAWPAEEEEEDEDDDLALVPVLSNFGIRMVGEWMSTVVVVVVEVVGVTDAPPEEEAAAAEAPLGP